MRGAIVVLGVLCCLGLAACAGSNAGNSSASVAAAFPPAAPSTEPAAAASAAPAKPRNRAAYRGSTAPAPQPADEPDHVVSAGEKVMQVRTDCWMGVDHVKVARDIDSRMTWVDKCIAEKMAKP